MVLQHVESNTFCSATLHYKSQVNVRTLYARQHRYLILTGLHIRSVIDLPSQLVIARCSPSCIYVTLSQVLHIQNILSTDVPLFIPITSALIWPIPELEVVLQGPSEGRTSPSGTVVASLLSAAVASDRGSMAECMTVSHTSSMFGITRIF